MINEASLSEQMIDAIIKGIIVNFVVKSNEIYRQESSCKFDNLVVSKIC